MMKTTLATILCIFCSMFGVVNAQLDFPYKIPAQTFDLTFGTKWDHYKTVATPEFNVSDQVTYGEYKEFLNEMQLIHLDAGYDRLVPSFQIGDTAILDLYQETDDYDKEPVIGIRWDAAMQYCRWLTLKDSARNGKITHVYRLPTLSEWNAMARHFEATGKSKRLDNLFLDWTMTSYDESVFEFKESIGYSYTFFPNHDDPPALKRMYSAGHCFLFSGDHPAGQQYYYYTFQGYRHLSFRVIKEPLNDEDRTQQGRMQALFNYWNVQLR